ncbi:MAG: ABC transporter substrate-binding protein [Kiloniellales bacterium]|nr:ABC transporter substrate-binding protein [Kiloniellales bacterium]
MTRHSILHALAGLGSLALSLVISLHDARADTLTAAADPTANPIVVGLDADMTKGAAQSGEAIRRGLVLAIEEINARGGVLGRPLSLVVRDHRGNPARGRDNIEDFAAMDDLVAVVGGIHTPVALAELEAIHRHGLPYLGPWAAGTPVVSNGFDPNFVFRVSVRDEHAGGFLVEAARSRGFERLGLLLWRTGWGRSNEAAMHEALTLQGLHPAAVTWFNSGERDMSAQIDALRAAGAEVIMLVANPVDGLVAIQEIAGRPEAERLPIISHWGITGGDFFTQAGDALAKVDLSFLQTFSFFDPPFPERAARLYEAYCARFGGCRSPADVISPVGTAHAYDLVQLLSQAIERAGTVDRAAIRESLERLGPYDGLMRNYDPAFTPDRHDALDASDFRLCRFDENGAIVPIGVQ